VGHYGGSLPLLQDYPEKPQKSAILSSVVGFVHTREFLALLRTNEAAFGCGQAVRLTAPSLKPAKQKSLRQTNASASGPSLSHLLTRRQSRSSITYSINRRRHWALKLIGSPVETDRTIPVTGASLQPDSASESGRSGLTATRSNRGVWRSRSTPRARRH
jgi:hypothetical protein